MGNYEELKAAALAATPGPWKMVTVPVMGNLGAMFEIAQIVNGTEGQATALYMLNANGLCPALTGTGPNAANNARFIELCSPDVVTALLTRLAEVEADLSEWEDCKHDGATYHDMSGRERCGRCGADL
ncbi:hypothetical protein [Serratia fonticola]